MYIVFTNIERYKNEKTKKKNTILTDLLTFPSLINSKAINQNKLKNL